MYCSSGLLFLQVCSVPFLLEVDALCENPCSRLLYVVIQKVMVSVLFTDAFLL